MNFRHRSFLKEFSEPVNEAERLYREANKLGEERKRQEREYLLLRKALGFPDFPAPPYPPEGTSVAPIPDAPVTPETPPHRARGRPPGPEMPSADFAAHYPTAYAEVCRDLKSRDIERRPTAAEMARRFQVNGHKLSKSTFFRYLGHHPQLRAQYPLSRQRS